MQNLYKKYRRKAKLFRFLGFLFIALFTLGFVLGYQFVIGWENFKELGTEFFVVQEESMKLNMGIALPLLLGIVVLMSVTIKRNKEFMKSSLSTSLVILLLALYLLYSVIELALLSLIGATFGAFLDDYIFRPLSKKYRNKAQEQKEIDSEYYKEKRRIQARQQAREELNGSV